MNCNLCGKYSGRYPMCKECYYKSDEDFWEELLGDSEDEEDSFSFCITCKEEKDNDGYHFCRDCYRKYKNKTLYLKVKNCTEFELLQQEYESTYRCLDGHLVKSKSEKEIDNYLFSNNIRHCYEKPIPISANEADDIHPDFYLYDMDVYIEHLGKEDSPEYNQSTQYKAQIYKKLKLTVIYTHEKTDARDMQSALDRKLKNFKKKQLNFL